MSSLRTLPEFPVGMSSRSHNILRELYFPCLQQSVRYVRGTGYFRLSLYRLMTAELLQFCIRGGTVDLLVSNQLEGDIYDAATCKKMIHESLEELLDEPDTVEPAKMLAALIHHKKLRLRVALKRTGMYHEKVGYFEDCNGDYLAFNGSGNETLTAVGGFDAGNAEVFDLYPSWISSDEKRAAYHRERLDEDWSGLDLNMPVIDILDIDPSLLIAHDVNANLDSHFEEAAKRSALLIQRWEETYGRLESTPGKSSSMNLGVFKSGREPLPHQRQAIHSWERNEFRGVLKHATGSGKTFTALMAMNEHLQDGKPVIVLVPQILLQEQWKYEIDSEFPTAQVLLVGSKNTKWKKNATLLSDMTSPGADFGPRVIIAVMDTAKQEKFRQRIVDGKHLLVIADEVHEIGTSSRLEWCSIDAGKRLGLSATPERHRDSDGTEAIFDWFGPVLQPEFTLRDALNCGRLVPYDYFPRNVHLTAEESESWSELSQKIKLSYARASKDSSGQVIVNKALKMLLIERSRIAKRAQNKVRMTEKIVRENYKDGERWLLFCEDQSQLNEIRSSLTENSIPNFEYHSAMDSDSEATLRYFEDCGGVLVSIKCLDQGIDIPRISHAIILASSQNPRQFIQRRGRVLRWAPSKVRAYVYDLLVTPMSLEDEPEQYSLVESEFARAIEFASTARNRQTVVYDLKDMAIELGLTIDYVDDVLASIKE